MGCLFLAVSKCTEVLHRQAEGRASEPCVPYLGNKCEILAPTSKPEL